MKTFSRIFLRLCIVLAVGILFVDLLELVSVSANNSLIPFDPLKYPGVNPDIINGVGSQGAVSAVRTAINALRGLLGPVLVFMIGGFAIQLMIAGGNEEKFSSAANHFFYVLVGVAIVALADFLSQTFFLYQEDTAVSFLSDNEQLAYAALKIKDQIGLVIKFLRYILGGIALIYVVKSGSMILFNAEDETVQKQKDVFIYGFTGLILIMGAEALINAVFDIRTIPVNLPFLGETFTQPEVNVGGGISLLTNITNLLLALMSGLFLFTLVIGGSMYAFSAGNEERGQKGTKVIVGSLIGLAIAFSSYTIVAEFSSGGRSLNVAPTGSIAPAPVIPVTPGP